MYPNRRTIALTAVALCAAVTTSSCSDADGDDTDTIKIVALGAFTGEAASQNVPVLQGAEVAVDVLNKRGGVDGRDVELIVEDDRGDLATMVTAAREAAADDNVYAVLVGNGTPGALAVEPVLEPSGMPAFSVATSPEASSDGWPGFYRMNSNAALEAERLVAHFQSLHKKSLGVLWENNDYGAGFEAAVTSAAEDAGVEIAASVPVAPGSSSLSPEVGKLVDVDVDYLTTALLPAETVTASRAIAAEDVDATVIMNGADMAFPAERALLGGSGAGIMFRYFTYPFDPALQDRPDTPLSQTDMSDEAKAFWKVWQKEYGSQVDIAGNSVAALPTYDWWSYDAILMVAEAIESGAAAPDEVVDEIDKVPSYDLVAGYDDVGESHEFHSPDGMAFGELQADGTITYNVD